MVQIKRILKTLDTGAYYLLISSENGTIACDVKAYVAEELLHLNPHRKEEVEKDEVIEFEFIEKAIVEE